HHPSPTSTHTPSLHDALPILVPQTLVAGATTTFQVNFAPTALGAAPGSVTISSTAPNNPNLVVPLNGTGAQPAVSLNPTSVNFGDRKSTRLNSSHLGISYAVF